VALAWARTCRNGLAERIDADPAAASVRLAGRVTRIDALDWEVPTRGTVVGTLLNTHSALAALGDAVNAPPYLAPPQAPVLYIKPANTWTACGATVALPANVQAVEIGATLGIVIGSTACRVAPGCALDHVAGYTIVNDICEPHASVYGLAIRQRCRDGFCAIGPWVLARDEVAAPDALGIRTYVNSELRATQSTTDCIRPVARLIADVTEFMTLFAGDVLLAGIAGGAPLARVGDRVRIEIDCVGALENLLVAESRP
jgi:5-oxopent-3-ene-1,2,5-tricarboxylate decarboxylase / 2-hydroxyhepta-2,4-diene-1,7-dioate isomerase